MVGWTLVRGSGFEGCPLGASREQVERALGTADATFRRVPSGPLVHDFQRHGAQVTFDESGRVAFVEVYEPADPSLHGIALLGRAEEDVCDDLRAAGIEVVTADAGFILPGWGVGLFVEGSVVTAVSAGRGDA